MDFKIKSIESNLEIHEIYNQFKSEKNTIMLDSSNEGEFSNYSFIGLNPYLVFKSKGNKVIVGEKEIIGDAFKELENIINKYKLNFHSDIPFLSGCIGYFSYDAGRNLEILPDVTSEDFYMYDSYFVFYDNLIIKDLKKDKTYITALGILKESDESIKEIKEKIINATTLPELSVGEIKNKFYSQFTKEEYIECIKKIKEYIRDGHVYIANMTQRFYCNNEDDSFNIYRKLRSINKAPFSAYMNLEDMEVISSSPERFIKIENGIVETRPIKGTRPRGKDEKEDELNKKELENSEKDKSELLMIVDLERNDLSKVCKIKKVDVTELFKLETYATVFHLVSTIRGELEEGISSIECMRECFPGGSITGAPKIRAMEIIEELEKVKRNLYTGSIGYFDLRGNADFNIVIRTIVKKDNKAYFGVGGGITIESIEEDEYQETLDKAKALMRVL